MSKQNPFTKELWERKAEEEMSGEPAEEGDFKLLLEIKAEAERNENLSEFFEDLEGSILRYNESIVRLGRAQAESWDIKDTENADQARKIAHDALLGRLDVLSREFEEAGLDNSWRKKIGLHRHIAGDWAKNVGTILKNSILKENGLEK